MENQPAQPALIGQPPPALLDGSPAQFRDRLESWVVGQGQPRFRARQIEEQVLRHRRLDPASMSNLPRDLRIRLAGGPLRSPLALRQVQESVDGTRKFRFQLGDGATIESVWIPVGERATLCVSSQAGCPAGCTFCATAASGFKRNLRPSEIVAQWLQVEGTQGEGVASIIEGRESPMAPQAPRTGEPRPPVTQMVFMGMGEPLFNYDAVATALRLLTSGDGFGFSPRRITVSTVGIPRRMTQLIQEFPQVRLALSLHSAVDETRRQIVPMNDRFDVASLRDCLEEIAPAGRRVTLEYVVLHGVNDAPAEADALVEFARGRAGHINLLPFHPFPGAPFPPTPPAAIRSFRDRVVAGFGSRVTIRRSRGLDIAGACGQLALESARLSQ